MNKYMEDAYLDYCDDLIKTEKEERIIEEMHLINKSITHKGYTLIQSDFNNHYSIFDSNGKLKMHSECNKRLTDEEKIEHIEFFIKTINALYDNPELLEEESEQ